MIKYINTTRLSCILAKSRKAISLVETVTVLVISAMIIISVLGIYIRVRDAAASVNRKLGEKELPTEILQRIAEDIDRLVAPGFDTTINIVNKNESGYNLTRMTIDNRIYDRNNKPQIFERIVWQTYNDPLEEGLSLYRAHSGLNLERKITYEDSVPDTSEEGLFIHLCSGITYLKIQIPNKENLLDRWTGKNLPKAITVSLSFAEPYETISGEFEVLDEDIITRTIAIDRTRKIQYKFVEKDFEDYDPNEIDLDQIDFGETEEMPDELTEKNE